MSIHRYARRRDVNEKEIVDGLVSCGVKVWRQDSPADLLTLWRGKWLPLEVKDPHAHGQGKRQAKQQEFIRDTGCPVVESLVDALAAIGYTGPPLI